MNKPACSDRPWKSGNARSLSASIALAACFTSHAQVPTAPSDDQGPHRPQLESKDPERCVAPASKFHGVNVYVLRAILRVESRLVEQTVTRNSNGTVDVGLGGTNSIHFPELARYGIASGHLLDACVATYVAAWHLSKTIARFGNTMFGVAAYHSATPYYNQRYQVMLYNELVRMKVIRGPTMATPPLRRETTNVAGAAEARSDAELNARRP